VTAGGAVAGDVGDPRATAEGSGPRGDHRQGGIGGTRLVHTDDERGSAEDEIVADLRSDQQNRRRHMGEHGLGHGPDCAVASRFSGTRRHHEQ
jgi:hypothetical protein